MGGSDWLEIIFNLFGGEDHPLGFLRQGTVNLSPDESSTSVRGAGGRSCVLPMPRGVFWTFIGGGLVLKGC